MNISLSGLLRKRITRKEFIFTLGIMFFGIFGISSVIKSLSQLSSPRKNKVQSKVKSTYGTGAYGV